MVPPSEEENKKDTGDNVLPGIPLPEGDPTTPPTDVPETSIVPTEIPDTSSVPADEPVDEEVKTDDPSKIETDKDDSSEAASVATVDNGELETLKAENTTLKTENSALKSELETSKSNATSASAQTDELQSKINDLEAQLSSSNKAKDDLNGQLEQAKTDVKSRETEFHQSEQKVLALEKELATTKSESSSSGNLQDEVKILKILLSTGSSALDLYEVLKNHRSLNLRKLAMQSGMAAAACISLLEGLEKAGLVKFERAGPDDTDPKITLISLS
ncbi:MAG: hypothetical protein IH840_11950 [Candidatus Heimdallarchaeota archaeon]|nr:hypothetical protein [Candidatus Heimdallarchaeota archaeon]